MKGLHTLFAVLLLVLAVLVAGSVQSGSQLTTDAGNPDIIGRIIADITSGIAHPLTSVCASPAFTLYEQVMNPEEMSKDLDHCIQFFAVQAGDTSQCPDIKRGAPMTKCYLLIAANKNDPAICNEIPATSDPQAYLKIDCLWEVAIKNNNQAACNAMGSQKISRMFVGEMSRQTCLARLASGQGVGGSTV